MTEPLAFAALADDLTGGLELASLIRRGGVRCPVLLDPGPRTDLGGLEAVVFGLRTRVIAARRAVAGFDRALGAIGRRGARQLFFKYCATFDSTPRGNIGPCADLLMDRRGAGFTLFCPAFPEVGRTVYQGHLFAGELLISDSPKRFDPLTPMREPNLVKVLQAQTRRRVGLLPHAVLAEGVAATAARAARLQADGIPYAVCDTLDEADLRVAAEASVGWPVMTGGSSVAVYYPDLWRGRGWIGGTAASAAAARPPGPAVVLAGSCADRTFDQLAHFGERRPVLFLDPARALDGADLVAEGLAWAARGLADGPVAVATSARPDAVAALQRRLGRRRAARLAEDILARLAVGLHDRGIRRFVISGGETSGAVLAALEVEALEVEPYVTAGQSHAMSSGPDPVSFYLKSGKLGPVEMLATVTA
ncbi:MAG: 3-oxo-tetronate kinase [Dongiaceae bacterium]